MLKGRPRLAPADAAALGRAIVEGYGALGDLGAAPGVPAAVRDAFRDAVEALEEAFCVLDGRAYEAWAVATSRALGFKVEPCDAWFSVGGPDHGWPVDALDLPAAEAVAPAAGR